MSQHIRRGSFGVRAGENHHNSKLTDHDVILIRELNSGPDALSYRVIAEKMECAKSTVADICTMRTRINVRA